MYPKNRLKSTPLPLLYWLEMFGELTGINILFILISIVVGLVIHEAMHGYVAHWLGDDTAHHEGRLTLNPLVHIDPIMTVLLPAVLIIAGLPPILAAKPVPFNPERLKWDEFGAALVGVAGPLTNLALAAIAALFFRITMPEFGSHLYNFIVTFASINIGIFVFNMIPIPPLDGSRLLYAFAPEPLQDFMRQIEALGIIVILVLVLFFYSFFAGPIVNIMETILEFLLPIAII